MIRDKQGADEEGATEDLLHRLEGIRRVVAAQGWDSPCGLLAVADGRPLRCPCRRGCTNDRDGVGRTVEDVAALETTSQEPWCFVGDSVQVGTLRPRSCVCTNRAFRCKLQLLWYEYSALVLIAVIPGVFCCSAIGSAVASAVATADAISVPPSLSTACVACTLP